MKTLEEKLTTALDKTDGAHPNYSTIDFHLLHALVGCAIVLEPLASNYEEANEAIQELNRVLDWSVHGEV